MVREDFHKGWVSAIVRLSDDFLVKLGYFRNAGNSGDAGVLRSPANMGDFGHHEDREGTGSRQQATESRQEARGVTRGAAASHLAKMVSDMWHRSTDRKAGLSALGHAADECHMSGT